MRILAFNVAHDSSVCVINNGKVEFFCKEERLSRIKRDKAPFKALELLRSLNLAGEPLVQTKADAINTFYNSALDALYFVNDNKLIIK